MLEAVGAWRDALTGATAEASADRALGALTSGRLVVGDCLFAASAVTVLVLAEREEAMTWLDAIEAEGHRRGSHFAVNAALLFRGRAELARGELDDAYDLAETLADDPEPLVQKALGWVLRAAGDHDRGLLTVFVERHAATMQRVALRAAIEHYDRPERARILAIR